MSPYLRSLLDTSLTAFAAGAVAVAAEGGDLTSGPVWVSILAGGILGVLKGLAARGVGDRGSAQF